MQVIKPAEGGSGGGVLIHAFDISIVFIVAGTIITANGGDPGHLRVDGEAGFGGAGWIAILYNASGSCTNGGTVEAIPGDDGTSATLGTACHPTDPLNTISVLDSPDIGNAPAGAGTTPFQPLCHSLPPVSARSVCLAGRKRKKAAAIVA